jgi:CheY-like chemotaxis protein
MSQQGTSLAKKGTSVPVPDSHAYISVENPAKNAKVSIVSANDPSDSLHRAPISDGEAIALLAHDMSNTIMVIQSRLDSLRNKVGKEKAFIDIQNACTQSGTVLRGALSLLDSHSNPKKLIALGEYVEGQLECLIESAHHGLRLRTHQECRVFASPETLNLVLVQVIHHFKSTADDTELSIDVYSGDYEKADFGLINISGPGELDPDKGLWKMLESLMHLQGGEFIIDTTENDPQVCLMFPIFQKRDSIYTLRTQTEVTAALIVEDNQDVAETVSLTLQALGIPDVTIYNHPQDALEWLDNHTPGLVITDYSMLGMNGIEFLKQAEAALASSTVVLMSGMPADSFTAQLEELAIPVQVLMKPLKGDDLMLVVMQALSGPLPHSSEVESLKHTVRVSQRPDMPDSN